MADIYLVFFDNSHSSDVTKQNLVWKLDTDDPNNDSGEYGPQYFVNTSRLFNSQGATVRDGLGVVIDQHGELGTINFATGDYTFLGDVSFPLTARRSEEFNSLANLSNNELYSTASSATGTRGQRTWHLTRIDYDNPSNISAPFGDKGTLVGDQFVHYPNLISSGNELYAVHAPDSNRRTALNLYRINPSDPSSTTPPYGNLGSLNLRGSRGELVNPVTGVILGRDLYLIGGSSPNYGTQLYKFNLDDLIQRTLIRQFPTGTISFQNFNYRLSITGAFTFPPSVDQSLVHTYQGGLTGSIAGSDIALGAVNPDHPAIEHTYQGGLDGDYTFLLNYSSDPTASEPESISIFGTDRRNFQVQFSPNVALAVGYLTQDTPAGLRILNVFNSGDDNRLEFLLTGNARFNSDFLQYGRITLSFNTSPAGPDPIEFSFVTNNRGTLATAAFGSSLAYIYQAEDLTTLAEFTALIDSVLALRNSRLTLSLDLPSLSTLIEPTYQGGLLGNFAGSEFSIPDAADVNFEYEFQGGLQGNLIAELIGNLELPILLPAIPTIDFPLGQPVDYKLPLPLKYFFRLGTSSVSDELSSDDLNIDRNVELGFSRPPRITDGKDGDPGPPSTVGSTLNEVVWTGGRGKCIGGSPVWNPPGYQTARAEWIKGGKVVEWFEQDFSAPTGNGQISLDVEHGQAGSDGGADFRRSSNRVSTTFISPFRSKFSRTRIVEFEGIPIELKASAVRDTADSVMEERDVLRIPKPWLPNFEYVKDDITFVTTTQGLGIGSGTITIPQAFTCLQKHRSSAANYPTIPGGAAFWRLSVEDDFNPVAKAVGTPAISIEASKQFIKEEEILTLVAFVDDDVPYDTAMWQWTTDLGTLEESDSPTARITVPTGSNGKTANISLIATFGGTGQCALDGSSSTSMASIALPVSNQVLATDHPTIRIDGPTTYFSGDTLELEAITSGGRYDIQGYEWTASEGTVAGTGREVSWDAGTAPRVEFEVTGTFTGEGMVARTGSVATAMARHFAELVARATVEWSDSQSAVSVSFASETTWRNRIIIRDNSLGEEVSLSLGAGGGTPDTLRISYSLTGDFSLEPRFSTAQNTNLRNNRVQVILSRTQPQGRNRGVLSITVTFTFGDRHSDINIPSGEVATLTSNVNLLG